MNTNTGGRKRRRRRRDLNSENDIDNIKKFINQPMSELILARQVMAMFFNEPFYITQNNELLMKNI